MDGKVVEIEKFYDGIMGTLDIEVSSNGVLMVNINGVSTPLLLDGLPVVLPTRENIKTVVELKNGKPEPVKYLFNPLDESAIKGENKSFNLLKTIIERKFLGNIAGIGIILFSVLSNAKAENNNMVLNKLLSKINKYRTPAVKQMIDKKTVEAWIELYDKIAQENSPYPYIKLYIKRGGKIDNIKYNRVGVITFPFLESLVKFTTKDKKFLDITLRNKDKNVFLSLFEFLFEEEGGPKNLDDLIKGIQFGSLNKVAPSTHLLFLMYDYIYKHLKDAVEACNEILESMDGIEIDEEVRNMLSLKPLPFDVAVISDIIDSLKGDIKQIPNMDDTSALHKGQHGVANKEIASPMAGIKNNQMASAQQPASAYQRSNTEAEPSNPWDRLAKKMGINSQPTTPTAPMVTPTVPNQPYPTNIAPGIMPQQPYSPPMQAPAVPSMGAPTMPPPPPPSMNMGGPVVRSVNPVGASMGAPTPYPNVGNDPWRRY